MGSTARPHDMGGKTADAIDTVDHGMAHWEKHANGFRMLLSAKGITRTDEMRRVAEDMGDKYFELTYFERHSESAKVILIERGILEETAIKLKVSEIRKKFEVPILDVDTSDHHHEGDVDGLDNEPMPNETHLTNLAMQELLEERGLITADEVRRKIENFDIEYPGRGAKVVARAWTDENFKTFLLKDAKSAITSIGIDLETQSEIVVVENTPSTHNVVVCTLCSCYPRFLLGQPPTWYKSVAYRSRTVYEPRSVLSEFGTNLSEEVQIRVHDSNADMRYMVLPMKPAGTHNWSPEKLERIVSRDSLVGVTVPTLEVVN